MKTVVALTKYGQKGASSRVRFVSLFPHLELLGWRVLWYPLLPNSVLEKFYSTGGYPVVTVAKAYLDRIRLFESTLRPEVWWIEKELYYGVPDLIEFAFSERILTRSVIDYDDGVFLNYRSEENIPFGRYQKFARYAKGAGMVTYGSEGIHRRMQALGAQRTLKIPSTVDVSSYSQHSFRSTGRFVIGWIGTPVTKVFLDAIAGVLQALAKRVEFEFHIVGATWECEGVDIHCIEWTQESETRMVGRFDVGIMPLRDTEWEHCKCGYKLIQYMAAGVVPVGAAIGENKEIISHGDTGFLCSKDSDWLDVLELLARDRPLCVRVGRAARLEAERRFDNRIAAKLVASAFSMVAQDVQVQL
jgi:glycosyltransferase involved in cell wall biosynthesis